MRLAFKAIGRPQLARSLSSLSSFSSFGGQRGIGNNAFFKVSDEVQEALRSKKPVVALETTIYTHGFPYPDNVALASLLESVVRVNGGVPATIGILDGVARVGMTAEEIIKLTESAGKNTTLKLSRRDLSFVCGSRLAGRTFHGGTTIAGTMLLAHLAGIKIFGTGGLGGVHRGAESSMDISADLTELGRTPVTVVSSGCKSFLDIPRTLEYLETEGVGIGTFADGRRGTVDFPCFWSRDSGVKSPTTIEDEYQAAAVIHAQNSLNISSGLLFANPIPVEYAIPKETMDSVIDEAIRQADTAGVVGKDNTPFILAKIKELTKGDSIPANRALIESNVKRATIVARELATLESKQYQDSGSMSNPVHPFQPNPTSSSELGFRDASITHAQASQISSGTSDDVVQGDIVVAGALAVDLACDYAPLAGSAARLEPIAQTSNPAVITQTLGGVAHNIAKAAHYLGSSVRLCSAVGCDISGRAALSHLKAEGMQTGGIKTLAQSHRTAQYVAINNVHKDLSLAMADMSILESSTPSDIWPTWIENSSISSYPPKCVVVDANWTAESLHAWLNYAKSINALSIFEPVSTAKSARLFTVPSASRSSSTFPKHIVDLATPNSHELEALHTKAYELDLFNTPSWFRVIDALGIPSSGLRIPLTQATTAPIVDAGIPQQAIKLLPFIPTLVIKLGPDGVMLIKILTPNDLALSSPEEAPHVLARNTNGDLETGVGGLYVRLFKPEKVISPAEVVSVNGIGDTFVGALAAGLVKGKRVEHCVDLAQQAAALSLRSKESVSPHLKQLSGFS